MHAAQHKKRQRIGKRIVVSLSGASNQKPKKQTPPKNNVAVSELSFPPPIPPHTQNKNSTKTKNRITTQNDVRHNRQKRKRGKAKKQ